MIIQRRRQIEYRLQDQLDRGEIEQVVAADHMSDALICIVKSGREKVCNDRFAFAAEDDIADFGARMRRV